VTQTADQIRFEVYKDGQRLTQFTPAVPTTLASESIPTPGDWKWRDARLSFGPTDQAMGFGLLWNHSPNGSEMNSALMLETTRLPPRAQSYVLNVELARGRLMKILQRLEDWLLLDTDLGREIVDRFRVLQQQFAEALCNLHEPSVASQLADKVLSDAIVLGDDLSLLWSELGLQRRRAMNAFPRHTLGICIDVNNRNQRVKDFACENFDYAIVPFTWKSLQVAEDRYDTEALDEWIDVLTRKRIPIITGPIIDPHDDSLPDWLAIYERDVDMFRELMLGFIRAVVTRYRKFVAVWTVCSGLNIPGTLRLNFEQTVELTRQLVGQVKQILPTARTLVGIRDPFGERHAASAMGVPPMTYADVVGQTVNCDGIAVELEAGVPRTGSTLRSLFDINTLFDRLSLAGKPIFITSLSCPGRNTPDPGDRSEGRLDPRHAGQLQVPWSPGAQADWARHVYRAALAKPFIESVAWADICDASAALPGGGMLDDMLKPKPLTAVISELRHLVARPARRA